MTLRVLVAGLGNMGRSHALAWHARPDAEVVGLVNRSGSAPAAPLDALPLFTDFEAALAETRPDAVVVATYTDTHAPYAIAAMEAGAHVFVEKPLAATVVEARRVVETAKATGRRLGVGYILRHHPSWVRMIEEARALGGPWVFRLNLNQQSTGETWETHKALMETTSPIVDCGVHYVDVMCQVTDAPPVRVHGIGLRLSAEIPEGMYNYGQLQVTFEDGSVGWYEAGWGPMASEAAHFVKDIWSPSGSVTIEAGEAASDDVDAHTRVGRIRVHRPEGDRLVEMEGEPGHQQLCDAEAAWMARCIAEGADMERHMEDAVRSLAVCLAADESIRTGRVVEL